jgi:hypothetical protein
MNANTTNSAPVAAARWVTIRLAAQMTGLTEKAIRRKIERGIWLEGVHWRRADGGIFIDMQRYNTWVEKATA